ncbi:MAG: hypothetical protein GY740_17430 [Gammaproteobacteria bacterium]|nr:hypothetical protein [Gammaproteobacteria bacterium]
MAWPRVAVKGQSVEECDVSECPREGQLGLESLAEQSSRRLAAAEVTQGVTE